MKLIRTLATTGAPAAVILIRFLVGAVFFSEGIQKFLFPEALGAGRFLRIGLPSPEILGPFVGACEIVCGTLLLAGFLTRPAAAVLRLQITEGNFQPMPIALPEFAGGSPQGWVVHPDVDVN